jgi:hypothetical protein
MNAPAQLERHYRRLLAFYPKSFRREHEAEMLSVLLAGATDRQRRPQLAEAANLVGNAILMRLLLVLLIKPGAWEYRHAHLMFPVRVAIGIWLLALTAVIYAYGPGGWWGVLLVPAASLHFYFAYQVRSAVQR